VENKNERKTAMKRTIKRKRERAYRTTLYLEEELIEELKRVAFENKTTMTDLINQAIEDYLTKIKGKEK
jgi:predicted DNA-binding ribbon-helix-helix protein